MAYYRTGGGANFPNTFTQVAIQRLSNSNSSNTADKSYTCPSDGIISAAFAFSNDSGSNGYISLNGTKILQKSNTVDIGSATFEVKTGDIVRAYAKGVKGSTSNASAYVIIYFATY